MFSTRYLATTVWCDVYWMMWPHRIVAEMHWAHSEYVTWIYQTLYSELPANIRRRFELGRVARFIHDCETARRARLLHRGYSELDRLLMYRCAMVARLDRVPPNTPRHRYHARGWLRFENIALLGQAQCGQARGGQSPGWRPPPVST